MCVWEGGFLNGLPVLRDKRHGLHGELGGQQLAGNKKNNRKWLQKVPQHTLNSECERACNTTCSPVDGLVLWGYLEEAVSVGEVTVEVAALVQLL